MSLLHKLGKEVSKVAFATGYFFVAFLILLTFKMLFLAEYAIETSALVKATVGALVVGKVVVVLSATPIGKRFRDRMVALDIAYQSLLHTIVVAIVVAIERIVHGYFEVGTWRGGLDHALDAANLMHFLATVMGVYLSFVGYTLLSELGRHFGRERVMRFLFTREGARHPPVEAS